MNKVQFIDDAEFQINIDLDQGARISSLIWRDMQFAVPFRGSPLTYGWYAMAPWWVVYTEDPDGICIEPQTAPPDAQNLGITGEHYIEALFVFEEE